MDAKLRELDRQIKSGSADQTTRELLLHWLGKLHGPEPLSPELCSCGEYFEAACTGTSEQHDEKCDWLVKYREWRKI